MFQCQPVAAYPSLSDTLIVSLIDLIGRDDFAQGLADLLEHGFGYKNFHIFLYRRKQAAVSLADRPLPLEYERGLKNYLNYTYVLNPAYRAFLAGRESGVYLMTSLLENKNAAPVRTPELEVHVDVSEQIGYRTPGWPKNIAEIITLVSLPNNTMLDFSFLTPRNSRQTSDCRRSLERIFPYLRSVIDRQFATNPESLMAEDTSGIQDDRFNSFGGDVLTAREREIAQLILIGHSSNSISLNLGISLPTVKTHRRNIYSKLQISSQAELFSLFLLHLK